MQKIIRAATVAASLSLAVLPVVGFTSAAFAQERVQIGDLQLSNSADAQTFAKRVNAAAGRFCAERTASADLRAGADCRQAVQAEVMDKLSPAQREALGAS